MHLAVWHFSVVKLAVCRVLSRFKSKKQGEFQKMGQCPHSVRCVSDAGSCSFGKRNFRVSGSKLNLSPRTKELNSTSFRDFFSLVGGFHPLEKYARQIGSFFPGRGNKKYLKPPPSSFLLPFLFKTTIFSGTENAPWQDWH